MKGSCSKTWKNPKNDCWMLNLRKSLSVKIHKNLPAVKEEYLVQPYCRRGLGEGGAIVTCCSQPGCNWNRETASGNIDINRSHIPSKVSHQLKIVKSTENCQINWKLSNQLKIVTTPEICPMDLVTPPENWHIPGKLSPATFKLPAFQIYKLDGIRFSIYQI